jgi:hypothetical protein
MVAIVRQAYFVIVTYYTPKVVMVNVEPRDHTLGSVFHDPQHSSKIPWQNICRRFQFGASVNPRYRACKVEDGKVFEMKLPLSRVRVWRSKERARQAGLSQRSFRIYKARIQRESVDLWLWQRETEPV